MRIDLWTWHIKIGRRVWDRRNGRRYILLGVGDVYARVRDGDKVRSIARRNLRGSVEHKPRPVKEFTLQLARKAQCKS